MGLYLMPAGTSSKNRFKSLEKSFTREQLKTYLPQDVYEKLQSHYGPNDPIYIWGANKGSISHLKDIHKGEYVLDVKNKEVPNVFQFCFWFKTPDTKLQEFIGWDEEKPKEKRRPYRYVYFLKNPQKPKYSEKQYYGKALGYGDNPFFLMGQRYIQDDQLNEALNRSGSNSVEEFIGIPASSNSMQKQSIARKITPAENEKTKTNKQNVVTSSEDTGKSETDYMTKSSSQKLKEGQVVIKENETGISYDDLFGKYLEEATDITVVDPYIRLPYQVRNFLEFAQVIGGKKDQDQILLHLVTNNHDEFLSNSKNAFAEIRDTLEPLGIFFTHEFDENIHDRHIKTDTGWKIILGRGLDIFQKPSGRFSIATLDQKQRKCKACEITYLKINNGDGI